MQPFLALTHNLAPILVGAAWGSCAVQQFLAQDASFDVQRVTSGLVRWAFVRKGRSDAAAGVVIDLLEARAQHRLSQAVWACWTEAAAVTMSRFHSAPPPPTSYTVGRADAEPVRMRLVWQKPDEDATGSHASNVDATEQGAYVVAAVAMHTAGGWRVRKRAQDASGADLIVLRDGDDPENFAKLEVSGIAAGTGPQGHADLRARLRKKIDQVGKGDLDLPGVAAVVGFELAHVLISEVHR